MPLKARYIRVWLWSLVDSLSGCKVFSSSLSFGKIFAYFGVAVLLMYYDWPRGWLQIYAFCGFVSLPLFRLICGKLGHCAIYSCPSNAFTDVKTNIWLPGL
jgi:hypothetical protein